MRVKSGGGKRQYIRTCGVASAMLCLARCATPRRATCKWPGLRRRVAAKQAVRACLQGIPRGFRGIPRPFPGRYQGIPGGCKGGARPRSQGIPRGFRARFQGIPRGFRGIPGDSAAIFGDSAPSGPVCQHSLRRAQCSNACYRNTLKIHTCWPPGRSPRDHRWVCTWLLAKPEIFPEQPPFNILEHDRRPASELRVNPRVWPRMGRSLRMQL